MTSETHELKHFLAADRNTFVFINTDYKLAPVHNPNFYNIAFARNLPMVSSFYVNISSSKFYEFLKEDGFENFVCIDYNDFVSCKEYDAEAVILEYIQERVETPFTYFGNDFQSRNAQNENVGMFEFIAFQDRDEMFKFILCFPELIFCAE